MLSKQRGILAQRPVRQAVSLAQRELSHHQAESEPPGPLEEGDDLESGFRRKAWQRRERDAGMELASLDVCGRLSGGCSYSPPHSTRLADCDAAIAVDGRGCEDKHDRDRDADRPTDRAPAVRTDWHAKDQASHGVHHVRHRLVVGEGT